MKYSMGYLMLFDACCTFSCPHVQVSSTGGILLVADCTVPLRVTLGDRGAYK